MSAPSDPSDPSGPPRDPRESPEPPSSPPGAQDAVGSGGDEPTSPDGPTDVPGPPDSPGSPDSHDVTDSSDTSSPHVGSTPGSPAGAAADRDEDALWRAIVENYGERARLDPEGPAGRGPSATEGPVTPTSPSAPSAPSGRPTRPSTRPSAGRPGGSDLPDVPPSLRDLDGPAHREPPEDGEHFVPPSPPPVPVATPPRLLAWIGLFGVPVLVLVALVVGWTVPSWLGLLLTLWFVGGFVFLVASMRPGQRDEDDDGAVL